MNFQTMLAAVLSVFLSALPVLIAALPSLIVALTPYPKEASWAKTLLTILQALSVLQHKDSPGTLKLPFTLCKPPAVVGTALKTRADTSSKSKAGFIAFGLLLFLAKPAHAQSFSAGLSVPLLEFPIGQTHPIAFAPGLGLEASVGFFQTTLLGESADMLVVSGLLFANAPGAMQVAATLGTFNNLICVGVAVPLYGVGGLGALQGSFNAFPVLGGNIPFDLGAAPGTGSGTATLGAAKAARKFGTVYLGLL